MRWRDIRFEKPTETDGDSEGFIVQLLDDGSICLSHWKSLACMIAWMPLSELPAFDRIPDPPEGWTWADKSKPFDKRAKYWSKTSGSWLLTGHSGDYGKVYAYIVPIDPPEPPEPQYRPFANAAEFEPYRDKWWRHKSDVPSRRRPPVAYDGLGIGTESWEQCFISRFFDDGSPFGVMVEE